MFPFRRRKDIPVLDASKIPSGSMNPPRRTERPKMPPPDSGIPAPKVSPALLSERTPDYVHKLLDNLIHGDPLNFEGCRVPIEVQERLMWAVAAGKLIEIPGGMTRGLG